MIVIKLGGAALKNSLGGSEISILSALAHYKKPFVIVHGGGPEINQMTEALGLKTDFVDGQRVTSPEVMSVVEMVLTGKVNPTLVRGLLRLGRKALGFSGSDGGIFRCSVENPKLGGVGKVERVDAKVIQSVLESGYIPVLSPIGLFEDGSPCNINADLAASKLAAALKADRLMFLTDRDGILDSEGQLMSTLNASKLRALATSETVTGGMRVKARAILEMLDEVPTCCVEVMNGLDAKALEQALNGASSGTRICQ